MRLRILVISLLTFAIATASPVVARPATCRATPDGGRRCIVGIATSVLDVAADRQHAAEWCWAATAEMIFRVRGRPIAQETIVREVFGSLANMRAQPWAVARLLDHEYTDANGRRFSVARIDLTRRPRPIAEELAAGRPLFVETSHHAMMLTALEYALPPTGGLRVLGAVVRDPWPDATTALARGRRVLYGRDLAAIRTVYAVRVDGT